jgi:hypothetical protein
MSRMDSPRCPTTVSIGLDEANCLWLLLKSLSSNVYAVGAGLAVLDVSGVPQDPTGGKEKVQIIKL